MVTTSASSAYTAVALRSFFANTAFTEDDQFLLIDNDGGLTPDQGVGARVEIITNSAPKSFAANANMALFRAAQVSGNFFFLNNDLVFTPGWLEPLLEDTPALLSPVSNAELPYEWRGHKLGFALNLEDYNERALVEIAAIHRERTKGYRRVPSFPFFCVKIPPVVYDKLGPLDEGFGRGGAEDRDYAVRALQAGFELLYALPSYVLHFQGKSTWRGPESARETEERNERYLRAFESKWGNALRDLFILGKTDGLLERKLLGTWNEGHYREVIEALLAERHH